MHFNIFVGHDWKWPLCLPGVRGLGVGHRGGQDGTVPTLVDEMFECHQAGDTLVVHREKLKQTFRKTYLSHVGSTWIT